MTKRCPTCGGTGDIPDDPVDAVIAAMRAACRSQGFVVAWDDRVRDVAAAWLLDGRATGTLANWRAQKTGPTYIERNGNVLYLLADIARYQAGK